MGAFDSRGTSGRIPRARTGGNTGLLVSLTSRPLKSFSQVTPPMLRSQGNLEKSINWIDTSRVTHGKWFVVHGVVHAVFPNIDESKSLFKSFLNFNRVELLSSIAWCLSQLPKTSRGTSMSVITVNTSYGSCSNSFLTHVVQFFDRAFS